MHSIDREGRLLTVQQLWLEHLGYTSEEVTGGNPSEFLTPESRKFAIELCCPNFSKRAPAGTSRINMSKKTARSSTPPVRHR